SRVRDADLIVVNTCSIREKPEHKVFSWLGRLAGLKKRRPDLLIAVAGCVAQQEGHRIFRRAPHVDIVFGPGAVRKLPALVKQVRKERMQVVDVAAPSTAEPAEIRPLGARSPRAVAFVTIMSGCDNFCTYCVVPYVRGREISRSPVRILEEIRHLVSAGVQEVTLLGQNVNSYGLNEGEGLDFAGLLARADAVKGLKRLRFTTSHPKDLSADLVRAFADLETLAPHIHLPIQSGSDRVLKRMNRGYTRALYLKKVDALRKVRTDIAVTTDIIVGFPGETRGDFDKTLELVRQVQFDNLYAFKYSDRPDVPASRFSDKLDEMEKQERLAELLEVQSRITRKKNQSLVGTTQAVLVEGLSKKGNGQVTGHTPCNKIVNFPRDGVRIGQIVPVKILEAFSHSLLGRLDDHCGERFRTKGGMLHAA
ncbi:MAG: tRNA (N6-isopentenyl adenosine(37)-C2)-methylthiotransferase MiaB, partial [Deltaproteobacteria bacterium]|nr:tRNA (N6-isopentenyl adenosine(37)-C2)-methylthiotransferase MiaB [Deltaproteobacteria bacterium]